MAKKYPSRLPQDGSRGFSPDEYRKNQENYRKNLQGHSNDTMGQADEEPDQGKLTWSDVYVVGRKSRTDLAGGVTRRSRDDTRVQDAEEALKTPRILSSKEFLEHYNSARAALGPLPQVKEGKENKKKRGKTVEPRPATGGHSVGSEPGDRGKSVGLRIIGGRYRGTRLRYSGDHRVRPMKDRVREAVFNLIGPEVAGHYVIDLFSGTGALALEALSRGATGATAVEVHFPTARVLRENVRLVGEKDSSVVSRVKIETTDVFFWGKNLSGAIAGESGPPVSSPWLVFCSPPYDFYIERTGELLALLAAIKESAPPDSLFVIEADERFDFDLLEEKIPRRKRRSYPPAEVAIYRKEKT